MDKITISDAIKFRRKKSEKAKLTFINKLKKAQKKKLENEKSDEGGDYWTISRSAISGYFKIGNKDIIKNKIHEVLTKHGGSDKKGTKTMYERNIEILHNFENFDFSGFKPSEEIKFLSKPNNQSIFKINEVLIQVRPSHVFTFKENDTEKIGAIWFVSIIKGYTKEEIGIYTKAMYYYLDKNYSKKFEISTTYCIAMDVVNVSYVTYGEILNKKVLSLLESTLESIKKII